MDLNMNIAESAENVLEGSGLNEEFMINNPNFFRNSRNLTNTGSAA